ncbi:hypothetical protein GWI33_015216 [Rhynchophorus ferrugineus]|uniref:Uncharacterized protein n=1 Tax=Rhynchophorus ferrugineus TaxID=354439 RepID=A0A834IDQ0_RHYFE|nr:hypothetical protein GWI33_015216 [Rhynchophorus ferrugineus]
MMNLRGKKERAEPRKNIILAKCLGIMPSRLVGNRSNIFPAYGILGNLTLFGQKVEWDRYYKFRMVEVRSTGSVCCSGEFCESLDRRRTSIAAAAADSLATPIPTAAFEKRGSVCLNKCLREVGAQLDASVTSATSPINVTTNPLENSVHFSRKTPQATIVVQQASVSLDHANVTSTILLKNGSDFVGNVHATADSNVSKLAALKSQKEENMKQLLDVANNLTLEEIHDFEMRYGSPHHNRSQSVKTPGRSSGRPNYLCLPQQRSRVASMPNTGVEEEYYRLRHFSITGKGVVNRGDSLKSRRSRSNNSVASSNSSTEQLPGPTSAAGSARTSASCSLASSRESSTSAPGPTPFRVLMLGGPAVGKSSLVSQFMTSEYLHAYDTSIDDESGEKSVSVLLAGEESELTFIDFATADLSVSISNLLQNWF